jgi:hypothetical protein
MIFNKKSLDLISYYLNLDLNHTHANNSYTCHIEGFSAFSETCAFADDCEKLKKINKTPKPIENG